MPTNGKSQILDGGWVKERWWLLGSWDPPRHYSMSNSVSSEDRKNLNK